MTPPRPRPPLNFSWVAEPPTLGGDVRERGGGATGRSLFSDSVPSLAPPSVGKNRPSDEHAIARGRLGGGTEVVGDEWKAQWSRRLLRGPVHSEYQARFPWPPRSALKTTSTVFSSSAPGHQRGRSAASASITSGSRGESIGAIASPAPQARSVSPLRRWGHGRGRADGAPEEAGVDNRAPRGASAPPRDRGTAVEPLPAMPRNKRRPSSSVDAAVQHPDAKRASENKAEPAAAPSLAGEEQQVRKSEAPRVEDVVVGGPPPSEELSNGVRGSVSDGREWAGGRDHVGGYTGPPSKAATADGPPVAEANLVRQAWYAVGREPWRGQAIGRGETSMPFGGHMLDSCQVWNSCGGVCRFACRIGSVSACPH